MPVFHCPKCLECWKNTRNLPEKCIEEAEPTRGDPIALDEEANEFLLAQENVNIVHVQQRRTRRKLVRRPRFDKSRRDTIALAYGYETVPETTDSKGNIIPKDGEIVEQGIRKYGGLNKSEAEMLLNTTNSNGRLGKKSRRSILSDSGKGSFDSLDTNSSSGFYRKSDVKKDSLQSRLTRVVDAAVRANKNDCGTMELNKDQSFSISDKAGKGRKSIFNDDFGEHNRTIISEKNSGNGTSKESHRSKNKSQKKNSESRKDVQRKGLISIDEKQVLQNIGKG